MAERAMPKFDKSPPELVERFGAILGRYPDAVRKPMFGYPAAFVGGNMATGLFADQWVVRLPEDEVEAARAAGAGAFEPMPGKPMKAFVTIPAGEVADDARVTAWVERGLALAASMPQKK
jgi:TfoX N-terminal domain